MSARTLDVIIAHRVVVVMAVVDDILERDAVQIFVDDLIQAFPDI